MVQIVQNVGLHFCNHDPIGCLKYKFKSAKKHKILANKQNLSQKIGYGPTPHGIRKHRQWLHHRDPDQ